MEKETSTSLESALKYFPYLPAMVYFFGFVSFNSYLNSYRIYEFNLISVHYLKTGMLYCSILFGIGLIIRYTIKTPTDRLENNKMEVTRMLISLEYFLMIASSILFKPTILRAPFLLPSILLYFFAVSFLTSKYRYKWRNRWLFLLWSAMPFVYFIRGVMQKDSNQMYFFVSCFVISSVITVAYLDYGDRKFNPLTFVAGILILAFTSATFGATFFKGIPFYFGGAENKHSVLLFSEEGKKILETSPLRDSLLGIKTKPLDVIYENEKSYYLLLNDTSLLTLNKNLFVGELVLNK